MKSLTDHKLTPLNNQIVIKVTDEKGLGGAHHRYEITGFDTDSNPSKADLEGYCASYSKAVLLFQNGPLKEASANGVTEQALLAIVIDRLKDFQAGPFSSRENALALTHIETGLLWLHKRTLDRINRGVEGKNEK